MITEKMLELLVLAKVFQDYYQDKLYAEYLDNEFDIQKLQNRYAELGKEFLTPYALNRTEKSD